MRNTEFAKKIRKMTDTELDRQMYSAHNLLHGECFCGDYEARAQAFMRHSLLAAELKRRRARLTS